MTARSMADDYTDEEVREAFQQGAGILPPFYDRGYEYELQKRGDTFDRWLAEHDRQVAERAWDEGCEAAARFHEGREKGHWEYDFPAKGMRTWRPDPAPTSPYRVAKGEQK